jgi:hypothetical protein
VTSMNDVQFGKRKGNVTETRCVIYREIFLLLVHFINPMGDSRLSFRTHLQDYMEKQCPVSCKDAPKTSLQKECKDVHARCSIWAGLGECSGNAAMTSYCAKSCDTCLLASDFDDDDPLCLNDHENCRFWADSGECTTNPGVSKRKEFRRAFQITMLY